MDCKYVKNNSKLITIQHGGAIEAIISARQKF